MAVSVEAAGTKAAAAAASEAVEAACQGAIAQHVRDRHGDEDDGVKHVMQELDALRCAVNDDVESAIAPVRDGLDRALREARAEQAASSEVVDAMVNDAVMALKTKVRSLEGLANSVDEVHSQLQAMSDTLKETQVRGNERAKASFAAAESVARRLEEVVRHISALLALPDAFDDGGACGQQRRRMLVRCRLRRSRLQPRACSCVPTGLLRPWPVSK